MGELTTFTWKAILVYLLLLLLTRLMGKKMLSQITFFDFVVALPSALSAPLLLKA